MLFHDCGKLWETSYPGDGCTQSNEITPGIYDRVFPLPTNLVRPLATFIPPSEPEAASGNPKRG